MGGASGSTGSSGTTGSTGGFGSSGNGSVGVIVGVGTSRTGTSIIAPNGQTSYETWEFWYDPRIEALYKTFSITGGGVGSTSAASFGQNGVTGQPNGPTPQSGSPGTTAPPGSGVAGPP